ncbi:MAG: ATP-binding cassette domain-containing protein [Clostridiales bacterium]|nr:ATP-binding cassette domain-containing protein [Clostridiales bacterium]
MRYQINKGTVSLQGETILNHIDFEIRGNDKIGLVGKNGAGKTTLLRLIAGELSLDRDDKRFTSGIYLARNTTIGMLHQNAVSGKDMTVQDKILELCPSKDIYSVERYEFEKEYDRIFTGFGFSKKEKYRKIGTFSGGEQTKIAMMELLLSKPDILLLDEPTNHLDVQAVEWMEDYIRSYDKAVVIVSHDRFFLDRTVEIVYDLTDGKLTRYVGNYSDYRKQRDKNHQIQIKNYRAQQKEIERLTELIETIKHKPKKASMARSKKKVLERMQKIERPPEDMAHVFAEKMEPLILGSKWVFDADKLFIGYDKTLQEITLRIRRGQKTGIIGANGTGKTTFLKTITQQIAPLSGRCQLGNRIEIGYYDQHTGEVESEKRVFEHFSEAHPDLTIKEVKTILARYLFRGEETGKKISDLSGGEKSRLVLAEILESRPNFLVLDEPTNHMDIPAKETLESAFSAYTGTILFISHDRYFINEIADALLIFEKDHVSYYPFGYEHYLEHLRKKEELGWAGAEATAVENTRLVQGLDEVPRKTRMQSAGYSTEQSYTDWQLELAVRQLQQAGEAWERFLLLPLEDEINISGMEVKHSGDSRIGQDVIIWMQWDSICAQRKEEGKRLEDAYTKACLEWYEKWQDYEDAFRTYRDK